MDLVVILRPMILLGFMAVAAVTDILTHKISNLLLITCFAMELGLHILWLPDVDIQSLGYIFCFLILLFMLFMLGMMGGADIKMYAVCAFTYPDRRGIRIIIVSILLGAVYSAYRLIRHGLIRERAAYLYSFISCLIYGIRIDYMRLAGVKDSEQSRVIVPMAVFIFIAACAVLS